MKFFLSVLFLTIGMLGFSQADSARVDVCPGLPIAKPEKRAACLTVELPAFFSKGLDDKLKKGEFSATYKLQVDCSGKIVSVFLNKGNPGVNADTYFQSKIKQLTFKPAEHNKQLVNSFVFVQIEVINGKFTVVVY